MNMDITGNQGTGSDMRSMNILRIWGLALRQNHSLTRWLQWEETKIK
jgi:hypothetical protein